MNVRRWLATGLCAGFVASCGGVAVAQSLRIVPIDPAPGAHVSSQRPTIEFEIHTTDGATLTRNDVSVTLDGLDASRDLQIAGSRLEIVPRGRLDLGAHQVDVSVSDGSGEHAVDHWTFTIDSSDAAVPTVRDDTSASDQNAYENGVYPSGSVGSGYESGGYYGAYDTGGFGYGGYGGYGSPFGAPFGYYPGSGALWPVGYGPYYYGEPLQFIYSGLGLGGFVTVNGFPGTYPLVPFAPYYYFVTVPVPTNYYGGTPIAVCHFNHDHRRRLLATRPVRIEHARRPAASRPPAWVAPHWHPTIAMLPKLPGTPVAVRDMLDRRTTVQRTRSSPSAPVLRSNSDLVPVRRVAPEIVTVPHRAVGGSRFAAPAHRLPYAVPHVEHAWSAPRVVAPVVPRAMPAMHFAPAPVMHFAPAPVMRAAPAPIMRAAPAPVMHVSAPTFAAPPGRASGPSYHHSV